MAHRASIAVEPDKLVHEPARLKILIHLATSPEAECAFTGMRDALNLSGGNLSVQLATLEQAGYVRIRKTFNGKKPFTGISLMEAGRQALERYLAGMEEILRALKAETAQGG